MGKIPQSVLLKLDRAKVHFHSLEPELNAYYALNPAESVPHPDSTSENPSFQIKVNIPVPNSIALIMGDALQNLRSALDYLVWELVVAAGKSPKKQAFPVCTTPEGFDKATEGGRLRGIVPDAHALISSLQPCRIADFHRHNLYILDELTNINKHRYIPVATVSGMSAENLIPTDVGGRVLYAGFTKGEDNAKIRPLVFHDEGKTYTNIAVYVTLNEGPAKGEEISTIFRTLHHWVEGICLPQFERFFN